MSSLASGGSVWPDGAGLVRYLDTGGAIYFYMIIYVLMISNESPDFGNFRPFDQIFSGHSTLK